MAYCTRTDIERRLPKTQLAELSDDGTGVSVNENVVNSVIDEAESEINLYLRGKHDIPYADGSVPDKIKNWCAILAIHFLYERRVDLAIPDGLQDAYDRTISGLKGVRDNKLMIDDSDSSANTAAYYKTNKTSSSRIFTSNDSQTGSLDKYFSRSRIARKSSW